MSDSREVRYLKFVERQTGRKLSAIAKDAHLSSTTLTRPVNDPDHKYAVKHTTIAAVEKATGILFETFEDDAPTRVENHEPIPDGKSLVPVLDVTASAGPGFVNEYEPQTHSLAFPPDYLKKLTSSSPGNLAIISVKGDSMEPTLLDDDIVLLDTSKKHLGYDGLFVLRIDEVLHVKRVGRSAQAGHVMILSDNPTFPAMEPEKGSVEAIGKVLWYGRKV